MALGLLSERPSSPLRAYVGAATASIEAAFRVRGCFGGRAETVRLRWSQDAAFVAHDDRTTPIALETARRVVARLAAILEAPDDGVPDCTNRLILDLRWSSDALPGGVAHAVESACVRPDAPDIGRAHAIHDALADIAGVRMHLTERDQALDRPEARDDAKRRLCAHVDRSAAARRRPPGHARDAGPGCRDTEGAGRDHPFGGSTPT
jgi:hypothetical protein